MEFWISDGQVFLTRSTRNPVELNLDPHFELPIPNRRREETEEAEQNVAFLLHPHKKPFFSPLPPSLPQQRSFSRLAGMRNAGGEIVEVQGGHIVRSIGRKDRHSKVCTAKGPRDRRVRLSAHTAIQFYDVQDRLGYDRPSKAVDWLIKNAKSAIDELSKLPAWHPSSLHEISNKNQTPPNEPPSSAAFSSSFLPLSLDSDSIADTIKSFFPANSAAAVQDESNKGRHFQDLRLSLHSIQDPTFDHPISFDNNSTGFADQNQRMVSWNAAAAAGGGEGGSGVYAFSMPPLFSTQRGPLQSSNLSLLRPWMEPIDQQMQQGLIPEVSSVGYSSGSRSFSGFRFPAGIHGEDVLDDGVSEKPSSDSSASHY